MREPWDLAASFIGQMNQETAQHRATADNALLKLIATNLARQDAAVQQQYGLDTLAQRNVYATQADTTAYDRQLARDQIAYQRDDENTLRDRKWKLEDATAAGTAALAKEERQHQRAIELERAKHLIQNGGQRRFGPIGSAQSQSQPQNSTAQSASPQGVFGPRLVAGGDLTLDTIRQYEGFRDTPYWDVNALRTGYGSDTVTRADGRVERVGKGTKVTREDAERDLARRAQQFQNTAIKQVGEQAWNSLSPGAHAALTSIAYNYGSLPANVAQAVKTGDPRAIAQAIASRASDNDGVNAKRRQSEAAMVLNGTAGAGPRRYSGESGQQSTSDQVLAAPVSNSAAQIMNEDTGAAPISPFMADYLESVGLEPVARVAMTENQFNMLSPELQAMLMPDVADYARSNSKGPTEYIQVRHRPGADTSKIPQKNLPILNLPGAGTPPPIETQGTPKRVFKDGKMVLEDGATLNLIPN